MEFKEIVDLLVSNGIGIVCIIYFMYRDYKFMGTLTTTLTVLTQTTDLIKDFLLNEKGGDKNV